ncbi:unnamed protein product [Dicrocoelium dendriticum]|nr:unnamed protein product [Dicrocoelium dendriticum]
MNPLTNTKNQNLMNERELLLGYTGTLSSWHRQYKDSAWIFIGGLNYDLTEGDVICVFSQYGEVVNINLVRDKKTGVSKGFAFLCYEDQRSTVLATDNLNGIRVAGRVIRVDHVESYKVPKDGTADVGTANATKPKRAQITHDSDVVTSFVKEHGCGPEVMKRIAEIEREQKAADEERIRRAEARKNDPHSHQRAHRSRSPSDRSHPRRTHAHSRSREQRSSWENLRNRSPPSPSHRKSTPSPGIKQEPPSPDKRHRSPHCHAASDVTHSKHGKRR